MKLEKGMVLKITHKDYVDKNKFYILEVLENKATLKWSDENGFDYSGSQGYDNMSVVQGYLNDGIWVLLERLDKTPISLLMEQLGVEEGEEFNLFLESGDLKPFSPYKFRKGRLINSEGYDAYNPLALLIYGKYTIKKIPKTKTITFEDEDIEVTNEGFEVLKRLAIKHKPE